MKGVRMSLLAKKAGTMGLFGMTLSWLMVGTAFAIFSAVRLFQEKLKERRREYE